MALEKWGINRNLRLKEPKRSCCFVSYKIHFPIMEVVPKKIEVYVARSGKRPFVEWIEALRDSKTKAQVKIRLDRMRLGNLGDCKSVGEGVFELRIKYGPGYRVYFGQVGNRVILLLCGGDKSTQFKDIQKAKEYWMDYRSKGHEKGKK